MSLPERVRCFVAVMLDAPVRRSLIAIRGEIVDGLPGLKPVSDAGLHLTLKFLGEIPRGEIAPAMAIVQAAASGVPMFESNLGGLGAFPSRGRPRVVWARMSDPTGGLAEIHQRLDRNLRDIGVRSENRKYTPHVTLARVRDRAGAVGLRDRLDGLPADALGVQEVGEISLMMSELRPTGAIYSELGRAALDV